MIAGNCIGEDYPCGDGQSSQLSGMPTMGMSVTAKTESGFALASALFSQAALSLAATDQIEIASERAIPIASSLFIKSAEALIQTLSLADFTQEMPRMVDAIRVANTELSDRPIAIKSRWRNGGDARLSSLSRWQTAKTVSLQSAFGLYEGKWAMRSMAEALEEAVKTAANTRVGWQSCALPQWGYFPNDNNGGGNGGDDGGHQSNGAWRIFIRGTYRVTTEIELVKLPENIHIPISQFGASSDVDKPHWDINATILGPSALDACMPDTNGDPATLQATVNGYSWVFRVEEISEDLAARNIGRRITGKSLSIELTDLDYLPANYYSDELATAQQLASSALPSEFELLWTVTDWLVTAGAWSVQRVSPIQAVRSIADAIRAVVVPSRTNRSLTIQPRYPVLPWEQDDATPAIIVPGTAIANVTMRQSKRVDANSAFVQGGNVGGVSVLATRAGTAGDRLIPTIQHNLITDVAAARQAASANLAAYYQQPAIREFTMPIKQGVFPLAQLGDLLQVELSRRGITERATVNAVSVTAQKSGKAARVRQRISLGEDSPNLWAKWMRNIPVQPLIPAIVVDDLGGGSVKVSLRGGGGYSVVSGSASMGDSVFIRDGRIDRSATSSSIVNISI